MNVVKVARGSDKRFRNRIRVWSIWRTLRFSFGCEQHYPSGAIPMQVSGRLPPPSQMCARGVCPFVAVDPSHPNADGAFEILAAVRLPSNISLEHQEEARHSRCQREALSQYRYLPAAKSPKPLRLLSLESRQFTFCFGVTGGDASAKIPSPGTWLTPSR